MSRAEPPAAGILDRISGAVRLRFALDRDAFARRVAEVLASYAPPADPARLLASLALDDLYLATACAAGEEAAWEEMEAVHFPFIRDFALRCARRDPPAGDVAEAVIAELWERGKIRQYAGRSSLRTWLGTVVAHTAWNALQRAGRTVSLDASEGPVSRRLDTVHDPAPARTLADATGQAIGSLDSSDKLLLLFYYEQEMTLEQMERILGKSKAALSRRLERVRRDLKARIEERIGEGLGGEIDLASATLDLARALSVRENSGGRVSNP